MKRKIIIGDLEYEIETIKQEGTCKYCAYGYHDGEIGNHRCKSIRNPENIKDDNDSFFKYCRIRLDELEIPLPGTLDFLPHDKNFKMPEQGDYKLPLPEAVKLYCSSFCMFECAKSCPLFNYKDGKQNN